MSMGLILEGGGNRCAFTAGVLDVLSQNNIFLPVTYAVSAGACNGMSYLSKQQKRNYRIFTEYAADKRYSSLKLLITTGSLFGFDFIFGELSHLLPFDFDEFYKTSMQIKVLATDCETGKPVVFTKEDMKDENLTPLIASASLPVVAKIVDYGGHKLLDGGVSAPIPIEYAINDGVDRNVIVMTRDAGYFKSNKPEFSPFLLRRKYKKYPALVDAIVHRSEVYNREKNLCISEQEADRAIIIQPSRLINIKRQCKDRQEMEDLYNLGVEDAKKQLVEINRFVALNS